MLRSEMTMVLDMGEGIGGLSPKPAVTREVRNLLG